MHSRAGSQVKEELSKYMVSLLLYITTVIVGLFVDPSRNIDFCIPKACMKCLWFHCPLHPYTHVVEQSLLPVIMLWSKNIECWVKGEPSATVFA